MLTYLPALQFLIQDEYDFLYPESLDKRNDRMTTNYHTDLFEQLREPPASESATTSRTLCADGAVSFIPIYMMQLKRRTYHHRMGRWKGDDGATGI